MEWSWGGRSELQNAVRGERRSPVGSRLFPSGSFSHYEREEVLGGNRALKTGYRDNAEPSFVFFEGFPKGVVFRAPLDQEFFHTC